jgi:hypothetical protein
MATMRGFPELVWVDSPAHLPQRLASGRLVVLDVAFAAQENFAQTTAFLTRHDRDLAAWVDHHKHDAWPKFLLDPRFVLVPNVVAHACPELVTPEVVANAGPVERVLAHSDFDGMMSATQWLCAGQAPYPEANEDARAADSPGRGHIFSARGKRLYDALEEHRDRAHTGQRHALLTEVTHALRTGSESTALGAKLHELAAKAAKVNAQAAALAQRGRAELVGLFVIRHPSNLSARLKKSALLTAESRAPIGVVIEGSQPGHYHVTAATFDEHLDLSRVPELPVGRSDFRFVNKLMDPEPVLEQLSELAGKRPCASNR